MRTGSFSNLSHVRYTRHGRIVAGVRKQALGSALMVSIAGLDLLKRGLDLIFAFVLIALSAPFVAALWLARAGDVSERGSSIYLVERIGYGGRKFSEYRFNERVIRRPFHRLPVLWNIVRGEMSFVGPRPSSPGDEGLHSSLANRRFEVRPGLICSWWLQRRANIAFDGEAAADRGYLEGRSLKGDLGIALRAIPALLMGSEARPGSETASTNILGLPVDNLSMADALAWIKETLVNRQDRPRRICFINPHCANVAWGDPDYRDALRTSDLNLADGIGMVLAGKITGAPIRENANGTDLFPRLCRSLEGTGQGIFLLGGQPGVAEDVALWIKCNHPDTLVSGFHHGYFGPEGEEAVLRSIRDSGAGLLLVAMGVPRQDVWIRDRLAETGVRLALGVGGLFDFYSGRIPRAPLWMREAGFEWFFRFSQEPQRLFRRYFVGNFVFLSRVLKQAMANQVAAKS